MGVVARGLHFDRTDLCSTRKQEVYLVVVSWVLWPSVVEQLVSGGGKHLRNHILIDITEIGAKFVAEQFLIDDVFGLVFVPESQSYKQTRVGTCQGALRTVWRKQAGILQVQR